MKSARFALLTSLLFSGSYIAAQYTTSDLGPVTTSLLRYSVALVFLCTLLVRYKSTALKIDRADLPKLILLGLSGIVGYHYFFLVSLRYTQVANTAIINATSPILTGILAGLFLKERLSRRNVFGVVAAFLGVILLLSRGRPENILGLRINTGDAIMLLATLSWVVYALIVKTLLPKYSGFTLALYASFFGVLVLALMSITEKPWLQLRSVSLASVLGVIYMGVFASGLGYLCYNLSIQSIGPTRTSTFVYSLVPVLVAALAFLFFGQPVTWVMGVSLIIIIAGLTSVVTKNGFS